MSNLVHPDWKGHFKKSFPRLKAVGEIRGIEFEMVRKDGSHIFVSFNGKIIRNEKGEFKQTHCILSDITAKKHAEKTLKKHYKGIEQKVEDRTMELHKELQERKQAEDSLLRERDRAQKYLDVAGVMMVALNEKGEITLINRKGCQTLDYKNENELIGRNWFDTCLPSQLRKAVKSVFGQLMRGNIEPVENYENPVITNTGEERIIAWHNSLLTDETGKISGILSSGEDITERKQAEESLRESETRYRQLVKNLPIGVFRTTMEKNGRVLMSNPAVVKMFGYETVEEFMKIPVLEFYKDSNQRDRFIETLTNEGAVQGMELEFKTRGGIPLIGSLTAHLVRDRKGKPLYVDGIIEDITKRRSLERQFRQAQKMESIGTLASGIAHDFNNILGAVIGYTELAVDKVESADYNVLDDLKSVYQASLRAKDLVNQILQFSRHADTSFKLVGIPLIVKEVIKLLRTSFPATIEIKQNIQLESEKIFADASQIHQVVMNLCTNALHAMREKSGILTVELRKQEVITPIECYDCQIAPGYYAMLIVQDTGYGMNNQTLQRIFEPYFTTKEYDEGTGLGLAVTNGIIKNHKGGIHVESTQGVGSIFTVYFPLIQTQQKIKDQDFSPIEGGNDCILYVDDEEFFLDLSKKVLTDLGYEVVTVNRGLKALEFFTSQPDRVDLLITDQTMPNMTGVELAGKIHQIRPDLPIILCTGFSEVIQGKTTDQIGVSEILYKPATKRELATAIRKVLNHETDSDH